MSIVCISSQVAYGPVGNSAAVPALEQAGFTVHQVPTTILSNHPGHCRPAATDISADILRDTLDILHQNNWLVHCGAVMTGYFRNEHQVDAVATAIAKLKHGNPSLKYLCDPVMGDDHTDLYVPLPVASAIRERLVPLADVIAPNRFELQWLTGTSINSLADAVSAARELSVPVTLATSLPASHGHLTTSVIEQNQISTVMTRLRTNVPHGTGDILSGLFLAQVLQNISPAPALGHAMASLEHILDISGDTGALSLPRALTGLGNLNPLPVETTHD